MVTDAQAVAFQASAVLEAAEDQRIWVMLSRDVRGREWAPPHPLLPEHRSAAQWAPVLHWSAAQARLYMFYAESLPRCLRAKHGSQPRSPPPPPSHSPQQHVRLLQAMVGVRCIAAHSDYRRDGCLAGHGGCGQGGGGGGWGWEGGEWGHVQRRLRRSRASNYSSL